MSLQDFSERAAECLRHAETATSRHDRDFFVALARAWYGFTEDTPEPEKPLTH
jgi:hypothetical protein